MKYKFTKKLTLTILSLLLLQITFSQQSNNKLSIERGKKLFGQQCSSCHKENKIFGAFPFQHEKEFYGEKWTYAAMQNFMELQVTDKTAKKLFSMNGNFASTVFPNLTKKDMDDILNYVDSFPYNPNSDDYKHRKELK